MARCSHLHARFRVGRSATLRRRSTGHSGFPPLNKRRSPPTRSAVFFWYPLDFTFVCPTEITAFSDRAAEFAKLDCALVGVSVDSVFSHLAWTNLPRNKGGLGKMNIPLIGDVSKSMSYAFGALVEDADDDMDGVSLRSTVIVNGAGKVVHVSTNDAPVGRSVDEVLRLVAAFQHVDKHGEVCPAGWKAGAATMKADPKGSQEYFNKLK